MFLLPVVEKGSVHCRPNCLVWHLTEHQVDAAAMKRSLEQEAVDHLAECQICGRRVERTMDVILALRRERSRSVEPENSAFPHRVRPASDF
jgi:hypothetical protein